MTTINYFNFSSIPSDAIKQMLETGVSEAISKMSDESILQLIRGPLLDFEEVKLFKRA
jgi:hypothetical protein